MKKFFGNKISLIAFISVAVVSLGMLIFMLVQPVFYGWKYSMSFYDQNSDTNVTMYYTFVDDTLIRAEDSETEEVAEFWVYNFKPHKYFLAEAIGPDDYPTYKEFYDEVIDYDDEPNIVDLLRDNEGDYELYIIKANGFTISLGGETMKCKTAIALTIVLGGLGLLSLCGVALSVVFYVKNKKDKGIKENNLRQEKPVETKKI